MEQKEDIGNILKEKLGAAQSSPKSGLWDRIENSLDKKDRKRRGFFFLWFTGGAGVILLLLLLWSRGTTNRNQDSHSEEQKELITLNTDTLTTQPESQKDQIVSYRELEILNDSLNEILEKKVDSVLKSQGTSLQEIKEIPPFSWDSVEAGMGSETGEYLSVKTTYEYYNSETGEFIETADKTIIDSLLQSSNIKLDSVMPKENREELLKKKDSLK
ncbi:MAG: hypothetical protein AAFP76_12175 [Bacteroidota bacterium]